MRNIETFPCEGCNASEARCAFLRNECCGACTHTFDGGATYKFLCWGCFRIIHQTNISGPRMTECTLCGRRRWAKRDKEAKQDARKVA